MSERRSVRGSLLSILILLAPGCASTPADQQAREAERHLDRGLVLSLKDDDEATVDELSAARRRGAGSPAGARAAAFTGAIELRRGRLRAARDAFDDALDPGADAPADAIVVAETGLGDLAFLQDRYEDAARHYARAFRAGDASSQAREVLRPDWLLFRSAVARLRHGEWDAARELLARVVARYPSSALADDARRRRDFPERRFTVQAGAFAQSAGAERLRDRVQDAGFDARVVGPEASGGACNRWLVWVGAYPRFPEARAAAEELQASLGIEDALVLP